MTAKYMRIDTSFYRVGQPVPVHRLTGRILLLR